nr:9154_t:CDS:2 [Entrophospora candida]CAG8615727.1 7064_t:CDS:2 [Entrophospora candida]
MTTMTTILTTSTQIVVCGFCCIATMFVILYIFEAGIIYATLGLPVYDFFNWQYHGPKVIGWCILVILGFAISYVITVWTHIFRDSLGKEYQDNMDKNQQIARDNAMEQSAPRVVVDTFVLN